MMRSLPTLTLKVPVDSGGAFGFSNAAASINPHFRSETPIIPHQLSYLSANTSQSMTIAVHNETSPLQQTPSSGNSSSTSTSQFFSKLKGGIARSRPPSSMRSASPLPLYPLSGEPRSPTFGNVSASSNDRPYSHWSADSISSSPSSKVGGLLKKSFSPATSTSTTELMGKSFTARPWGASSGLNEEFDPTTFRKNRSRPRKKPEDVYFEYDDLFDDSTDNYEDMSEDKLGSSSSVHELQGPPRSMPLLTSSATGRHETAAHPPVVLRKWNAVGAGESNYATPPQSKPPSVAENSPPSPIHAPTFTMPPTPPPPPKTTSPTNMYENLTSSPVQDASLAIFSPGPPPVHAPPPVPPSRGPSKSKRGSVKRGASSKSRRSNHAEGLGIINTAISPSLNFVSHSFSRQEILITTGSIATPLDSDRDPSAPSTSSNSSNSSNIGQQTNLNTASSTTNNTVYRIPRKEVASVVQRRESSLEVMTDVRATNSPTGFTPQMRIVDFRDLDNAFAVTSFDDTPVASPNIDTMKEVVDFENVFGSGNSIPLDTMKEVISENTQPIDESNNGKEVDISTDTIGKADTTHLRVFRQFLKHSGQNDAFIHRFPRFDALQTQRICTHLRSDYAIEPPRSSKKPMNEEFVCPKTSKILRQREVADQMLTGMWALMALRWMNFGKILFSPAQEVLVAVSAKKASSGCVGKKTVEGKNNTERRRVLDLGGAPIGDWGWHCAYDYPKSKVYTVTARSAKSSPFQAAEPEVNNSTKSKGPKNHRHLVVSYLWRLPFPENHFDVVSARSLYTTLKVHRHASRSMSITEMQSPLNIMDEYDLCLEECLRVLKPGGYLEFNLLDNDIINPGPLGLELSTKFADELHANAYDPNPTRKWIQRLNKAGYGEIKRAWVFFPMAPQIKPIPPAKEDNYQPNHQRNMSFDDIGSMKEEVRRKMEAWEDLGVKKGSTELAAPVTGLLGSWTWEKWMLKTSSEAEGASNWSLSIDTIGRVLEEGREMGSGWRTLVGWARKPLVTEQSSFGMRMRADSANSTHSGRYSTRY